MVRRVSAAARNRMADRRLVLECVCPDRRRQGEDHVETRNRQQLRPPCGDPGFLSPTLAFGTVTVALIRCRVAAVGAASDMPAERRGAAGFDRAHHPTLVAVEVLAARGAERGAVAAEDVRHLDAAGHVAAASGRRDHLELQLLQRARRPADETLRELNFTFDKRLESDASRWSRGFSVAASFRHVHKRPPAHAPSSGRENFNAIGRRRLSRSHQRRPSGTRQ